MARAINEDFKELCSFINSYDMSHILVEDEAKRMFSSCHKKYYAYLLITEEFRPLCATKGGLIAPIQYSDLQESCSDVGQAFFMTINGCYKGAKLLLRSSIENFLKSICFDEDDTIVLTKSVYEVFDKASVVNVFSSNSSLHNSIHNEYSILCRDVHTSDENHMEAITSLSHFPAFDKSKCKEVQDCLRRLLSTFITVLSLKYNDEYHKINYAGKEILNREILKSFRKKVQNID